MKIYSGAQMIAKAAAYSKVNFFAGYPITPASSVYSAMLNELQSKGDIAIGASDEISAISMCIGASMRGAKAMTATSAPGLSLMIENIGYAFATETPLVIVLGQRLGPSTGAATQSAEGDISFVANLISGGYQIPTFAINSIQNSFKISQQAINTAELYRTPVILLSEKDILMSQLSLDENKIEKLEIKDRKYFEGEAKNFQTYNFSAPKDVPEFLAAGGNPQQIRFTASMHDKSGNLLKSSPEALEVLEHHKAKIEDNYDKYSLVEKSFDQNAQIAVISFLATDLAAKEAVCSARKAGLRIKHLSLMSLFPIAEKEILEATQDCTSVVIPEENQSGQYAEIIRHLFSNKELIKINEIAKLINPQRIYKELIQIGGKHD